MSVSTILGIQQLFTTTYHTQANCQTERFNRNLLQSLRSFVAGHQRDWDEFSPTVTHGYNNQIHRSTGIAPFELVVSRTPVSLSLQNLPSEDGSGEDGARTRSEFLQRLASLMSTARSALTRAQQRYKDAFDSRTRPQNDNVKPGD